METHIAKVRGGNAWAVFADWTMPWHTRWTLPNRCARLPEWGFSAVPPDLMTPTLHDPNHPKIRRIEVYWTTVTYKTVAIYIILGFTIITATLYLFIPDWFSTTFRKVIAMSGGEAEAVTLSQNQARFVNLDGKVQVKKVSSVQWVDADYRTTLDKGDLVQTGSDGAARITFADGTTYTVKSDSLVTVEENNVGRDRSTTAMRINVGAVDLATGNWQSPDSKAAVSVEDATASLRRNSRASVKNDPFNKESEIVLSAGSAQVQRGQEKIELAPWEKATITTGGPILKSNVLAPPELAEPLNLQPLIVSDPRTAAVHFEWKPVAEAVNYTLRISTTAMFTKTVAERKVTGTGVDVDGLNAGDYFWNVTATDPKKRTSEASNTFKFSLVAQGKGQEMQLEVEGTQLHGRVAEIIGRTEPGAALIVNGQPVPNIAPDGKFRHFTEPLQPGSQTIVITGQNRRGGTAIQRVPIVVPK